ncbi:MAG: ABC transporter permease [Candidatus Heimdallarchaeaceae archaeon]
MLAKSVEKEVKIEEIANKTILILAIIALGTFLLSFFYIPLAKIIQYAFIKEGKVTFEYIIAVFTDVINLKFISFTFIQALVSTSICLIVGLPTSYLFSKYSFKGRSLLINLLTIPFVLPPIVVLLGFIITYGEGGWFNRLWMNITNSQESIFHIFGTATGIIIAHIFYNLSVVIRMTIPAWESVDSDQMEVSKTLGAGKWKVFWRIIFPQIINYIISSALLVFIYTFNSFAIVLFLGESKFQTLEVRIYKLMNDSLKIPLGSALAILQLVINTIVIVSYLYFEKKTRQMARGKERGLEKKKITLFKGTWKNRLTFIGISLYFGLIALFSFAPIIAVIIQSFIPHSQGFSPFWGYKELLSTENFPLLNNSPLRLLGNTLFFASVVTIITLFLSMLIVFILRNKFQRLKKYKSSFFDNLVSYLIILPMGTSAITLALGIFLNFKDTVIFNEAVWIFIILAHVLISVPFATRSILSAYNRIDVELLNIASTLGANRFRIFRKIELPLILKSFVVGGIFSFAISLGEFGATNFLVRGKFGTLSIGISKLLYSQTIQLPASMASILIFVTIVCFMLIQKLGDIELKV